MEAAFFDLDKTVISKSSSLALTRPMYRAGLVSRSALIKGAYAQLVYLLLGADEKKMDRAKEGMLALTRGWDKDQVETIIREALSDLIDPYIYLEALDLMELHRALGRRVFIVSSSAEEVVRPLAEHLGRVDVIATRPKIEDGKYTGELEFYCYGDNKAVAIREVAERSGIDLSGSYAYSDSATDLPMLEAVGHPVAVNPDRDLRKEAEKRGWQVRYFRRPVRLRERLPQVSPPPPRVTAIAGTAALAYDAVTHGVPYPADQNEDDGLSITYTAAAQSQPLEITGQPSVDFNFSTEAPLEEVNLVAKLCDIQPDGRSFLITHDNVNASTAVRTVSIEGRDVYRIALPLRATSYRLGAGHRLRLSISGANFPYIWPTPRRYVLLLRTGSDGGTSLTLPVVSGPDPSMPAPQLSPAGDFRPAAELDGGTSYGLRRGLTARTVEFRGERRTRNRVDEHSVFSRTQRFAMSVDADHPDRATTSETATIRLERPVASIEVRVDNIVTLSDLYLRAEVRLDGNIFFERTWEKRR